MTLPIQLNQNTAYLDASVIYGSTEKVARSLREYAGGRMRVTIIGGDYVILPVDPNRKDCITDEYGGECFVGGISSISLVFYSDSSFQNNHQAING